MNLERLGVCRLLVPGKMTRCDSAQMMTIRRISRNRPTRSFDRLQMPVAICPGLALALLALGLLAATGCQPWDRSLDLDKMFTSFAIAPGIGNYSTNQLHEGDVVQITFQYSTNFNAVQKIGLDGMLNLDMVGTVKAAGKSLIELQQDLAVRYKPLVKDDIVTVKLVSSAANVYLAGAVLRPGPVEMSRPLTVLEAVMAGGGFDSSRAKLSAVTVLRIEGGQQMSYHINLNRVLDGKDKSPFYLKPFDIIYVPAKTFNY